MQIVAIGGGELRGGQTRALDRFLLELTGKPKPRALFVPTASHDAPGYRAAFAEQFGTVLGCATDELLLYGPDRSPARLEDKILGADLIYVGGGNTLNMMKLWRRFGVDRLLETAARRGAVLAGLSAGAICWHDAGLSDSLAVPGAAAVRYARVRSLGFRPGSFCPHLDSEGRDQPFRDFMRKHGGIGIACDDLAAVWYPGDGRCVAKTAAGQARAWLYGSEREGLRVEAYRDGEELPL